ncbi:MAG: iron ABC transporter permease, partial [Lentisphaeria bacterium]|nr:iron ABC transporter permease [Lentisphaeria bacterium]
LLAVVVCGGTLLPPGEWRSGGEWDPVFILRLMRQLTALTVGASLAVSGAVFQTVLRNPLAEPFTLGISGGSGVGAALAIVLNLNAVTFLSIPLCALRGARGALGLVLFGAGWRRDGGESILLGGVIVGTIFGSILMYILSVADNDQLAGVTWWMLGDLQAADPRLLLSAAICLALALTLLRGLAGELNALAFGDAASWNFGGDPVLLRKLLIVVASLLAAGTVALAGMIGFVGLMIPHAVRRFCGCDHRKLLPVLAVSGGVFLMLCDILSRSVYAEREFPIGVITSAVGGTLFLYLLKRRGRA